MQAKSEEKRVAKLIEENTKHAEKVNAQIPLTRPGVVLSGYYRATVDPRDGRLTYTEI
jgi:hypothetical protein